MSDGELLLFVAVESSCSKEVGVPEVEDCDEAAT